MVCVAHGLCSSRFHSTRRKVIYRHHVTRCLAKTSYPTSRYDVAVTRSLQQDGAPSHTARNTETCSIRTCSSLSQTFCPPNSPDLNTPNLSSWGALQQTVYHHQSFSPVDKMKESDCQKHGRNYTVSQKTAQLWNGIARNCNDRCWWYLAECKSL